MTSRSEILEELRKAVSGKVKTNELVPEMPFFRPVEESLIDSFKKAIENVGGRVTIVEDSNELASAVSTLVKENGWKEIVCREDHIKQLLNVSEIVFECKRSLSEKTEAVISGCEALIAGLGSVIVSSAQAGSRKMFVYPAAHIIVAQSSQLVETLDEGMEKTIARYAGGLPSMISIITGPSRTADIEKTLVLGAHGPKMVHVFIVNQDIFTK